MKGPVRNPSASVRARLLNMASVTREDYNVLLVRFALERLLYRISRSAHRDLFVLKGAMLFAVWRGSPHRATRDLDLLGLGDPAPEAVGAAFRDVCATRVEDDGVVFDPSRVRAQEIRPDEEYGGVRIILRAMLGTARLDLQVDVGFGDAITPRAVETPFPVLLGHPTPLLRVYPRETVVAEKTETIVSRGLVNSRVRDYYDLRFLAENYGFSGEALVRAVRATFAKRKTALPQGPPEGLSDAYAGDPAKRSMWTAFLRKNSFALHEPGLPETVEKVSRLVLPVLGAAHKKERFAMDWRPGGTWQ